MRALRVSLVAVLCAVLVAQEELPTQTFRTTVNVVVAPVTVMDQDGRYVNDLQAHEFRLLDNEKPQDINEDITTAPISLVIAMQANADVEPVLPTLKKIGPMVEYLLTGERGEAALMAFDHRLRLMTDGFTSDANDLTKALEKIHPGSSSSRMIDAVMESVRLLRKRPRDRRRVILLISETRDIASEGRVRDALTEAELHNVLVYSLNISRLVTTVLKKQGVPRPDPIPATARHLPGGAALTPTTAAQFTGSQGNSANFVPVFVEIFRSVKAIVVPNPTEVFTEYTGGREYTFVDQRSLEQSITALGEELQSQYLLSYVPNNKIEGGFHRIRVEVGRPGLNVRTRPGYWMAAVPE